ncbi:MAG: alpha/beta hydrolase, partial [Thermoleophilia bacterium]|nr:alpha/beta hydrolase [Thermoleophilia bacterium]
MIGALLLVTIAGNLMFGRLPHKPPMPGKLVRAGDRELHYIEQPGEGTPVVMIHGMPSLALDYSHVMESLSGARAIAFDRPGYGWSRGGPLPFELQLDAVRAALGELGVDRAVFVGHSYGAVFSLAMAERHPELVDALVLAAPAAGGSRVSPAMMRQARWIRRLQLPGVRQVADLLFMRALRKIA